MTKIQHHHSPSPAEPEKSSQEPFTKVPQCIRRISELNGNDKLLLSEIIGYIQNHGEWCWATDKFFAGEFGMSEKAVNRSISSLVALGYLSKEIVAGRSGKERHLFLGARFRPDV